MIKRFPGLNQVVVDVVRIDDRDAVLSGKVRGHGALPARDSSCQTHDLHRVVPFRCSLAAVMMK